MPDYDADIERESLRMTIAEVSGGDPVHLVGWSNGGRAVLAYTAAHEADVATVTAVEPAAWWLSEDEGAHALQQLSEAAELQPVTEDQLQEFLEIVRVAPPGIDLRQLPQWENWASLRNALSWFGPRMRETVAEQFREIDAITQPVLLARGTWTAPFLREVVDIIAARLPDATVIDLEGGHACLLMSADAFVAAVSDHTRRRTAAP